MKTIFPSPIKKLPQVDTSLKGATMYLSQSDTHQIVFMEFNVDVSLPEHSHESQWGVILEGKTELEIDGVRTTYTKGDRYFIPEGIKHSGKAYAGASVIEYFDSEDRYIAK